MTEEIINGTGENRKRKIAKSAGTNLWGRWKNRNAKEKVEALVRAVVTATVAGGLAVGTVGYVKANDAQRTISKNEGAWLKDLQGAQDQATLAAENASAAHTVAEQAKTDAAASKATAEASQASAASAETKAASAETAANKAQENAAAAQTAATNAQTLADNAKTVSDAAQVKADTANAALAQLRSDFEANKGVTQEQIDAAQSAADTANQAVLTTKTAADTAQATANKAASDATKAIADAANAKADAGTAQAAADAADAKAVAAQATADAAQAAAVAAQSTADTATAHLPDFRTNAQTENLNGTLTAPAGASYSFGLKTFDGTSKYFMSFSWYRTGFATHCTGGWTLNSASTDQFGKPYPQITPGTPIDDYTSANYISRGQFVTPPAGTYNLIFHIDPGGNCKYSDISLVMTKVN